jgi:hypothetical protein
VADSTKARSDSSRASRSQPAKGRRITGSDRDKLAKELRKGYTSGQSIRALAASHGRSYGFVHRVLSESGTALRGRGGATRKKTR